MKHKQEQTKKEKPKHLAKHGSLVDVCLSSSNKTVYLVLEAGSLKDKCEIVMDDSGHLPPPKPTMPWMLPRIERVKYYFDRDNDARLFSDIRDAIKANCYLPNEKLYSFLAAWILHTHLHDKANYSPIIIFYAVAARGKTRTCRTLLWMARRGIHVETIREADIIRKSDRFGCAFFFDIMNLWKKAERLGSEDILLGRFDSGITVPRVTNPERNGFDDTQHYSCFGPTLIATNEPAHHILNSRGILITMQQAPNNFETDPREKDFLETKERCTAFRARHLHKELPEVDKPARDRLGDILRPIAQIYKIAAPDRIPELLELIKDFEGERADMLSETPEGQIIKALIVSEFTVISGKITTQTIVDYLNQNKPERFHTTPISVGKRLSALGFVKDRIGEDRAWQYDQALIKKLAHDFGCSHLLSGSSGGTVNNVLTDRAEPPDWEDADAFDEWAAKQNDTTLRKQR